MSPISIDLQIDELLLAGFAPGERGRIGAALGEELTRLIDEGGLPPALLRGGAIEAIDGGTFQLRPGARPEWVGRQIAEAIYRQLSK